MNIFIYMIIFIYMQIYSKNPWKNFYMTKNWHQAISRLVGCLIRLKNVRNDVQGSQDVNTNRDQEGD